jgi:hypothetical protein
VRIGLGTGESTRVDGDYFGMPAIEAARLCDKAPVDGILVSPLTKALAGRVDGGRFEPAGELELKGIPDPIEAFIVAWQPSEVDEITTVPLPAALSTAPPSQRPPPLRQCVLRACTRVKHRLAARFPRSRLAVPQACLAVLHARTRDCRPVLRAGHRTAQPQASPQIAARRLDRARSMTFRWKDMQGQREQTEAENDDEQGVSDTRSGVRNETESDQDAREKKDTDPW